MKIAGRVAFLTLFSGYQPPPAIVATHPYIAFDRDANHAGQQSAATLAQELQDAGLKVCIAELPEGQDPNSYFVAGATAADFVRCLNQASGHV